MLSFCRSGLFALTLVSGSIADVQAQVQRKIHQSWVSDVAIERLQDKSVLTEYFGEGASREHEDIIFRVGFVPRFGCAPLITFKIGAGAIEEVASGAVEFPSNLGDIDVFIDGSALSFPTLVDNDNSHVSVYLNSNLQRRITARVRIEIGSRMLVRFSNGKQINFSLLGSRDAISIANQNCRRHDPELQG